MAEVEAEVDTEVEVGVISRSVVAEVASVTLRVRLAAGLAVALALPLVVAVNVVEIRPPCVTTNWLLDPKLLVLPVGNGSLMLITLAEGPLGAEL